MVSVTTRVSGVSQPGQHGLGIAGGVQVGHHGADHARGGFALRRELADGIKSVLRRIGGRLGPGRWPVGKPDPADAPGDAVRIVQARVDVEGLVRAMKVAHPDVNDADPEGAAIVARHRNRCGQIEQCGVAQCNHASFQYSWNAGRPTDGSVPQSKSTCVGSHRRSPTALEIEHLLRGPALISSSAAIVRRIGRKINKKRRKRVAVTVS